jgi:hypothetical protein
MAISYFQYTSSVDGSALAYYRMRDGIPEYWNSDSSQWEYSDNFLWKSINGDPYIDGLDENPVGKD